MEIQNCQELVQDKGNKAMQSCIHGPAFISYSGADCWNGWIFTKKQYISTMVFVNQFSGLGYIYLQVEPSMEETVEAKETFEQNA